MNGLTPAARTCLPPIGSTRDGPRDLVLEARDDRGAVGLVLDELAVRVGETQARPDLVDEVRVGAALGPHLTT